MITWPEKKTWIEDRAMTINPSSDNYKSGWNTCLKACKEAYEKRNPKMTKPNNPPAFPTKDSVISVVEGIGYKECRVSNDGMTLREYYAGIALGGMLANRISDNEFNPKHYAETAYLYADAMLCQRKIENAE